MEITKKPNEQATANLNTSMLIMQCIGIIAVVFGHADIGAVTIPNFLNVAFPYYSWHMPFFVFISGYFFNRTKSCGQYILPKLKTHLLPAFLVNLACGIFSFCLKYFKLTYYGQDITLKSLFITPFTSGYQFHINVSLWFIFCLVVMEILACLMDRLTRRKCDVLFLVISLAIAVYCSYKAFYNPEIAEKEYLYSVLRLGYLMFFFWLGVCYKKYAEKLFEKILNYKVSIAIFLIQATLLGITKYQITTNVRNMRFGDITVPNGFWVAIVAPITATLFFLGISYSLAPYFKNNKTLANFGRSTKYVMYYHQLVFVIFALLQAILLKLAILDIKNFSFESMRNNAYYTGGNTAITCVIAILALILPIIIGRAVDKQKWYIKTAIYIGIVAIIVAFLFLCGKVLV